MEKGINLSLTKSLAEFDALLDSAIKTASSKKTSMTFDPDEKDSWKFQVGKHVEINFDEDEETAMFWIGYGWEEKKKPGHCIWIEFDAKTSSEKYWDKINKLVGTSGKYYSDIDFEFSQTYMNAWIHFFLRDEYLKQFYDENTDKNVQLEILTEFIKEVLSKM